MVSKVDAIGSRLSVVMITMNEEQAVVTVIQDIKKVVPEAEIIIVDSSQDNTAALALENGAKVIRQFPPCGYGPAMTKALRAGTREVILTLDCDNTYPARQIPILAKLILEEGYDLVDASRLQKKPAAMPWANYLGNRIFAGLASALFLTRLTDLHSGMRAYRKTMLDTLEFEAKGAALPVELLLKPLALRYQIYILYIDYHERIGESKMQAFETSWWTLKRIIKVWMLKYADR